MEWNFSHFSIRWKTDDGFWHELTERQQEKVTERNSSDVMAHISKFAKVENPNYIELEESY